MCVFVYVYKNGLFKTNKFFNINNLFNSTSTFNMSFRIKRSLSYSLKYCVLKKKKFKSCSLLYQMKINYSL